jgi:fatty-acyl-CoA synthase
MLIPLTTNDFLTRGAAVYKCPTSVDFVDILPRTATGKVQKYQVRAPHWAGRERQVA